MVLSDTFLKKRLTYHHQRKGPLPYILPFRRENQNCSNWNFRRWFWRMTIVMAVLTGTSPSCDEEFRRVTCPSLYQLCLKGFSLLLRAQWSSKISDHYQVSPCVAWTDGTALRNEKWARDRLRSGSIQNWCQVLIRCGLWLCSIFRKHPSSKTRRRSQEVRQLNWVHGFVSNPLFVQLRFDKMHRK